MSAQPPKAPPVGPQRAPLSIRGTFSEAYALLWSNRDGFLLVGLIPVAASFLLTVIANSVPVTPGAGREAGILLAVLAADLIPTTLFAVGWHRLILLGPEQANAAPSLRWGSRETTYLWRSVLLVVGTLLAMAIPVSIAGALAQRFALGHLLFALVSFLALFVMVRLALVLPASAVDAPYDFSRSWNDTAARGLRLVAIVFLVALPLFLLLQTFNGLVGAVGLAAAAPFTVMLLNSVGSYVLLAALLTVFSLAFRRLSGWPDIRLAAPARDA